MLNIGLLANIFAKYDEEAGSYVFTKAGNITIIVVMAVLLLAGAYIAGRKKIDISVRELAVSAILIALAFA